jgi:hypothetical protein
MSTAQHISTNRSARLLEALRTDELRDALARRAQMREQQQSSYRVHTQLWRRPTATRTPTEVRAANCKLRGGLCASGNSPFPMLFQRCPSSCLWVCAT